MERARRAAAASGGSVRETSERAEALEGARGAVRQGMGRHRAATAMRPPMRGCAPRCTDWCVRDDWFASAARLPRHALPAGATQQRHRRRGARQRAQHRAARSLQPPAGADGRAPPVAQILTAQEGRNSHDHAPRRPDPRHPRAEERGALHPHVQGQDLRGEGRRRRVRGRRARRGCWSSRSRSCTTSACAWCWCTAAVRSSPKLRRRSACRRGMVEGRRITDEKSIEVTAMVLNGLINTRVLAICRDLDIEAVGISGVDAGLVRAHKRAPVAVGAGGELVDFGFVGDIDAIDTRRDQQAARQRPDAGGQPAVGGRSGHAAEHQRRHGGGGARRRARRGEAHPVHRRPGHPRQRRRPRLAHLLYGPAGTGAPARAGAHRRRHAAEGARPSRMRSAAACAACTWSPTAPRKASSARCSPTRAPAR